MVSATLCRFKVLTLTVELTSIKTVSGGAGESFGRALARFSLGLFLSYRLRSSGACSLDFLVFPF
jgi:hypothetical protein